jgi:MipA family protein
MRKLSQITATLVLAGVACAAKAQGELPLWEYGLSGFGIRAPAYVGSDQSKSRSVILPWFIYRGEVFRADGETMGARVVKQERVEFDVGFGAALGASSQDVQARAGMPGLGFQFEVGPRAKIFLTPRNADSSWRVDLPYRAVVEFKDGLQHRGMVFEPELKWLTRIGSSRLQLAGSAVWGDARYGHFLYGVPLAYATPTRAAYEGKAGLITTRLDATLRAPIAPDWTGFGFLRYDNSSNSANRASPLYKTTSGTSIGGGLSWTIGKSATKVSD